MGSNDPNFYDAETGRMIDLDVLRGIFDEHVDANYDPIEGMGTRLKASAFLRAADRPAYDEAFNNWADSEVRRGRLTVGPPEFTCECGDYAYPLVKTDDEEDVWCDCGHRIEEQRAEAQRRKELS